MPESREKLISENMGLVYHTLHKYYPRFIHDEDLIQCGMIGLIRGIDTYDETKSKFSTYVVRCILNAFRYELRSRKKFKNDMSMSQSVAKSAEGEDLTLEEVLPGDIDVEFTDYKTLRKRLTKREAEVMDLLAQGFSQDEVGERLGCAQSSISRIYRSIRLKWSDLTL